MATSMNSMRLILRLKKNYIPPLFQSFISSLGCIQVHNPSCTFCTQNRLSTGNYEALPRHKMVGKTRKDQLDLIGKKPDSPPNSERLNVAIIGTPNAGKSTLTNRLMGWRITSVSKKVHTTRHKIVGVLTEEEKQLVFLDTPGIVPASNRKRHHLEESLVTDPFKVLDVADIIAVVVDASNKWTRTSLDNLVLKALYLHPHKKSILVLNKVDAVKTKEILLTLTRSLTLGKVGGQDTLDRPVKSKSKKHLKLEELFEKIDSTERNDKSHELTTDELLDDRVGLAESNVHSNDVKIDTEQALDTELDPVSKMKLINKLIRNEHGWAKFDDVFMISALNGDGIHQLREYLFSETKCQSWDYHSSIVTDQDPVSIVKMCVWEKLLEYLPKEIPYNIDMDIPLMEVNEDGLMQLAVTLWCKDRRYTVFTLGKHGNMIRRISMEAKQEIMNTFRCDVKMKLVVKTALKK